MIIQHALFPVDLRAAEKLRAKAEFHVLKRFPRIIVGSNGWNRAVNKRLAALRDKGGVK